MIEGAHPGAPPRILTPVACQASDDDPTRAGNGLDPGDLREALHKIESEKSSRPGRIWWPEANSTCIGIPGSGLYPLPQKGIRHRGSVSGFDQLIFVGELVYVSACISWYIYVVLLYN